MTAFGMAGLRRLALKMLAERAGPAAGADALAAATHRAYDDLALALVPLIGEVGVQTLTDRALHLAQQEYPWLVSTRERKQADTPLTQVIGSLKRQDPAVAAEVAGALFAIFTGLLVTFIGEPLTARLLRKAWPDAFSDASTEET